MSRHDGALRFARYAYPPNELGYCGPSAHDELLERVDAGAGGPGLAQLARGFDGAWPYLALLAGASGRDPLADDVVAAYWVGNRLLDDVAGHEVVLDLDARFRDRGDVESIVDPVRHGAVPHHSLHVLAVYPWAGLLRAGRSDPSLQVMEHCLIRWGRVREIDGDTAAVDVTTLVWRGGKLRLGPARTDQFLHASGGHRLVDVRPGSDVAVHWSWICDVLTPRERLALEATTRRNLRAVNAAHPCPDLAA